MSLRLSKLLLGAGCAFMCLPFWIATTALILAYIGINNSPNVILDPRLFTTLLWYAGLSLGVPASIIALCARTDTGKRLAISAVVFAIMLIVMGSFQRRMFEPGSMNSGYIVLLLQALIPLVLWIISVTIAIKAVVGDRKNSDET